MNHANSEGIGVEEIGRHPGQRLRFARAHRCYPARAGDAVQDALVAAIKDGGSATQQGTDASVIPLRKVGVGVVGANAAVFESEVRAVRP